MLSQKQLSIQREILDIIFHYYPKDFNIKILDGCFMQWSPSPSFTLIFKNKKVFKKLLLAMDDYEAGVAFIEKDIDIEGDMLAAMRLADLVHHTPLRPRDKIKIFWKLLLL